MSLILDFQEQRGAKLAGVGNQLIVDRYLLSNLVEIGDPFRAQHFLYLKNHGVAVLKHQRHLVAYGNPPLLLFFYNVIAKLLADFFVSRKSENVVENDL